MITAILLGVGYLVRLRPIYWLLGLLLLATGAMGCGGGQGATRAGTVSVNRGKNKGSQLAGSWESTTAPPTTAPPTTDPPTTAPPTTAPPTATALPTTDPPTTALPTTDPSASMVGGVVPVDDTPASKRDMAASPGLTVSPPWPHPWPTSFEVGDAIPAKVPLYSEPGLRVPDNRALSNPTWEGVHLVFLVRQDQGEWLHVQIQSRPNGATAWIRRSDVNLRTVENHIVVERQARKISVYHGESLLLTDTVATGAADSPTPTGSFFVDYIGKPKSNDGPYGAYQLSVTGYSEVYTSFDGGVGQIALHGTNHPELIGTPASHGCVRMTNPTVERVEQLAPVGTPVDIYP